MSASLGDCESGSHWSFAFKDMLAVVLSIVKDEGREARVHLVGLDGEADTVAIVNVNGMFDESDLGLGVLWLSADLQQALVDVISHAEAFSVLSSNTVSGVIELTFTGWTAEGFWVTS